MKDFVCSLLFASVAPLATNAAIVLFEDFEDSAVAYSLSDAEASDGLNDYWGRVDSDGISISAANSFGTPPSGTSFFAAEDIGKDPGITGTGYVTFENVAIAGLADLSIGAYFASSYESGYFWSDGDLVTVQYQIDGGGYTDLFQITHNGSGRAAVDSNFDGLGEGTTIGQFQPFSWAIEGTGSLLDLRIGAASLGGAVSIAFDDVSVSGTAIPEPKTYALVLGSLAAFGLAFRRRQA
ncbi:MAG: hypothetical protein Q7P63_09890 [Verrucomicrobiota bacterium JB022]|nr:hypothetical protein [Verrucomicrobiota bacterium JB022]